MGLNSPCGRAGAGPVAHGDQRGHEGIGDCPSCRSSSIPSPLSMRRILSRNAVEAASSHKQCPDSTAAQSIRSSNIADIRSLSMERSVNIQQLTGFYSTNIARSITCSGGIPQGGVILLLSVCTFSGHCLYSISGNWTDSLWIGCMMLGLWMSIYGILGFPMDWDWRSRGYHLGITGSNKYVR
jgi:hypothetical protein